MTEQFYHKTEQNRFELIKDGHTAFAAYTLKNDVLFIDYVEAPPALRGTGAAGRLMQHVLETAKDKNWKVTPICGYAASWLRRHKEYNDILA